MCLLQARYCRDVVATTGVSLHLWRVVILAGRLHLRLRSCSRLDGDILGLCSNCICIVVYIAAYTFRYIQLFNLKGLSVYIFRFNQKLSDSFVSSYRVWDQA